MDSCSFMTYDYDAFLCAHFTSRSQSGNKADSFAVPTCIAIKRCKLVTFKRLSDLKFEMTATCLQ